MIRRSIWSAIILASSGLLFAAVLTESSSPGRTVITLWFFLICPGMAYIQSLRVQHRLTKWTLAVALSIAIDTLVALAILYGGVWDYRLGMIITIAITWIGVGIYIGRTWTSARHEAPPNPSQVIQ